ncbi:hypothetical protein BGZ93_000279 [Podila epicladia]|nr:hypothetical protein BGZ93_000279 [Podila epicladia]
MCFLRKTASPGANSGPRARKMKRSTIHMEQEENISPSMLKTIEATPALSNAEAFPAPYPFASPPALSSVEVIPVFTAVDATSGPENIGNASAPSTVQTTTALCTIETTAAPCIVKTTMTPCTIEATTASSRVEESLSHNTTIHLERVDSTSEDFAMYRQMMGMNLQRLYRIEYNDNNRGKVSGQEWSQIQFFHGTGHCGCIDQHVNKTLSHKMDVTSWCESEVCAVGGILRHGHLMSFSPGGHFFSPSCSIALGYAQNRGPRGSCSSSIFVCKARHFQGGAYKYVTRDEDIHPAYLAVVS